MTSKYDKYLKKLDSNVQSFELEWENKLKSTVSFLENEKAVLKRNLENEKSTLENVLESKESYYDTMIANINKLREEKVLSLENDIAKLENEKADLKREISGNNIFIVFLIITVVLLIIILIAVYNDKKPESTQNSQYDKKEETIQKNNNPIKQSSNESQKFVTDRIYSPNIAIGDSYTYESTIVGKSDTKVSERTVTDVQNDKVITSYKNVKNNTMRTVIFDTNWNLIATRNSEGGGLDYSPAIKYFDFPLYPGKIWSETSTETNIKTGEKKTHVIFGTVKQWEEISVPAGTFRTIQISLKTELTDHSNGKTAKSSDISWYAPDVRRSIKTIQESIDGKRLIQLLKYTLK